MPPLMSDGVSLPARALSAISLSVFARSMMFMSWAFLMTGTTRPRSVWAAKPRLTWRCSTISSAAVSSEALMVGNFRSAAMAIRMMIAVGLTLTSDCDLLSSARKSHSGVASASTQVTASGIWLRERVIWAVTALRSCDSLTRSCAIAPSGAGGIAITSRTCGATGAMEPLEEATSGCSPAGARRLA